MYPLGPKGSPEVRGDGIEKVNTFFIYMHYLFDFVNLDFFDYTYL
ncbi:MAG: hypothetical protein Q8S84_07535 [bacterium]|nr:hypothetical protein [bacterium]